MAVLGVKLADIPFDDDGTTQLCDVSMLQPCPVTPQAWRKVVFDAVHGS